MPRIFISYRREDTQWPADRLYQALKQRVQNPEQNLFIDIDDIPLGVNFKSHIESQIANCDIVLVLIGRAWADCADPITHTRRLEDPNDFVRLEIAAGLAQSKKVVPVFVDGASAPKRSQLPANIQALLDHNGVTIRRDNFHGDFENLIARLGIGAAPNADQDRNDNTTSAPFAIIIAVFFVVAVAGTIVWALDPLQWRTDVVDAQHETLTEEQDDHVEPAPDQTNAQIQSAPPEEQEVVQQAIVQQEPAREPAAPPPRPRRAHGWTQANTNPIT